MLPPRTASDSAIRVEGLDHVLTTLNQKVREIPLRSKSGMIKAGLIVQREAQKLTPVDLGNLRASAFTVWSGGGSGAEPPTFVGDTKGRVNIGEMEARHAQVAEEVRHDVGNSDMNPAVEVGFSAYYAIYVHENLNARHTTGEAQFLQRAMVRNIDAILTAIREDASRGKPPAGGSR